MKSKNITTPLRKHKPFFFIIIFPTIIIILFAIILLSPSREITPPDAPSITMPTSPKTATQIKSVRVDLSSMPLPENYDQFSLGIINQLLTAGANTVYLNPWSDGEANYQSQLAPLNSYGRQDWLPDFIELAHQNNLTVYAWFVIGKDNFPVEQHPEWYARTITGQPYLHHDEPGIELPFASLINQEYLNYHLALVKEVNELPIDGWVISEPLIGWCDIYDPCYTDFSSAAIQFYESRGVKNAALVIAQAASQTDPRNLADYEKITSARSDIVTNFVSQTLQTIREKTNLPVTITVFTEPLQDGNLKSFLEIKDWLGTDIAALSALNPDVIEIQSIFADFEHPQPPTWTSDMSRQFRQQLGTDTPLAVSVQGFSGSGQVTPADLVAALESVSTENIVGTSFYAYHTLTPQHWQALAKIWKKPSSSP